MATPVAGWRRLCGRQHAAHHADRRFAAVRIVPKGLRSFDANDADFFLELVARPARPGRPAGEPPLLEDADRDRRDPDETFAVGLIYGPSGCGKSSLVKAGLLPRLGRARSRCVYVEATGQETEARLAARVCGGRCPALPGNLSLVETLAALRQGAVPGRRARRC